MIIPIGHEQDTVRRLPWITFGVMILCVVAFFLTGQGNPAGADAAGEIEERAERAIEYWWEHTYLELDPRLQTMVFGDIEGTRLEEELEALAEGFAEPPEDLELRREEQQRLDELTAEAFAAVSRHPFFVFGLVPNDVGLVPLFTHMFLHAGLLHLFGNLLILYLAGPFIEDVWGRPLYAAFYVASGIAAALTFVVFNLGSGVPIIGASGAIAGVMGAFLIRYWNTKIRFFYVFGLLIRGTFDAAAWIMLPLWFAEQVFFVLMEAGTVGEDGGIAYWAHIGGFAFGVGTAVLIRKHGIEERIAGQIESKVTTTIVHNPRIEQALAASSAGNVDEAMEVLAAEVRTDPTNEEAALAFWGVAAEHGRAVEAAPALAHVIREELRSGAADLAVSHWSELQARVPGASLDADLLIRIAQQLVRDGRRSDAAGVLRKAMMEGGTAMPSATALRIARLARDVDDRVSRGAARLALARDDLGPVERTQAEALAG